MSDKKPRIVIGKSDYDAVICDMDGVVTRTARIHAAAWKKLFDEYLQKRAGTGKEIRPFDSDTDYRRYVDGKPRYEGVKSFLASRNIELPQGSPDDDPDRETVCGLGNRKNTYFLEQLQKEGVEVYDSTIDLLYRLRGINIKTAIVTSSKNCVAVLKAAHITDLFDAKMDGVDAECLGLAGKPEPDIFLEAAAKLNVEPSRSVVVEDAMAGVKAGSRGGFGCVIGVDRTGDPESLQENGADMVVSDMSEVSIMVKEPDMSTEELPSALEAMEEILENVVTEKPAVFLDYDGTLTPIVPRPEDAFLSESMRETLKGLAEHCTVAVISGRDLPDVRKLVGLGNIFYGGSHGFEIACPDGKKMEIPEGTSYLPVLDKAQSALERRLSGIHGAVVERKKFSIAAHYRNVERGKEKAVEDAVDRVLSDHPVLRKSGGKKIYELQPDMDWNKGKALQWLMETLKIWGTDVLSLYIGDDVTDEDAFRALRGRGIGIIVRDEPRSTAAQYALEDPEEVRRFLDRLTGMLK